MGASEKVVPRFKENVNKVNPFIRDTGHSEKRGQFLNAIPKLGERGAKKRGKGENQKKRGRSRNGFNSKKSQEQTIQRGRTEDFKRKEEERKKLKKEGKSMFVKKKDRRRSKKQTAGPLSASDLWSLNRYALAGTIQAQLYDLLNCHKIHLGTPSGK